MLELNKLTRQVDGMTEALASQRAQRRKDTEAARELLLKHAQVTDELRSKIKRACEVDESWRGADPLGDDLNERFRIPQAGEPATLVASDGSQIYPDTHAIALYYLTNIGTIVLRQGSGEAPLVATEPILRMAEDDPLEEQDQDRVDADEVNLRRDLREVEALAALARRERDKLSGDMERMVVALADGPLLPWMPQRLTDPEQTQRVKQFTAPLNDLRSSYAVPLGYVDRPRSANVLRLLHLAGLPFDAISKESLRSGSFRGLSDAGLFQDLLPGQRTALFAATSEINENFRNERQRIFFCYMNVASEPGEDRTCIARIETPEWIALDSTRLDAALTAVWSDCRLLQYPYLLTRAHELALVTRQEKDLLEQMLRTGMMHWEMRVEESAKASTKRVVGGR